MQSVSLGTHQFEEGGTSVLLMENMPTMLLLRHFPAPQTYKTVDRGYRDSPDPNHAMAIVFTKVQHAPFYPLFCPLLSVCLISLNYMPVIGY